MKIAGKIVRSKIKDKRRIQLEAATRCKSSKAGSREIRQFDKAKSVMIKFDF